MAGTASTPFSPGRATRFDRTQRLWQTWMRVAVVVLGTLAAIAAAAAYPLVAEGDAWLGVRWERPWLLLGLVVIPFVLWRGTFGEDRRLPHLKLGTVMPLQLGPRGPRVWFRDVPGVLRAVGLAFLIAALGRPISVSSPTTVSEEGIDLVVVLDLSGSMQAAIDQLPSSLEPYADKRPRGVRPTRLDAAKAVIRDFIARRKTDRIGVVVFGKDAYVLSPPTLDYQLLDRMVSKMEVDLLDNSATAIGDALGVAVARLRRSTAKSKAVILLTDGDNNAGKISPDYAAHLAAEVVGAKVFTVQIGDGETAEVHDGFDLFGQPRYVTRRLPANPELLRDIADKTGGQMYVATDAGALQATFHSVLDTLEKTQFEAGLAAFRDLYRYLLIPGVLLLALDALLRALLLRRFP